MRGTVLILVLLLAVSTSIGAQKKAGKGKRATTHTFLLEERTIITGYYRGGPGGLPPGLAKRGGDLPPGLEKHIRRDGQLPPGLQKRLLPFPPDLAARLRPLAPGFERGIIGHFAIILNSRTQVVVDVVALK